MRAANGRGEEPGPLALPDLPTDDHILASGTPRAGGFGPFEPARLLVIDPQADVLVESVAIAGSSPLVVFVR